MRKSYHLLMGIMFGLVTIYYMGLQSILMAPLIFVGSLIPDVDLAYKHRKIMHNVWVPILITGWALYLGFPFEPMLFFCIGYLSHLVADSFTEVGIYPFWPIKVFRVQGSITTGSIEETFFMTIILLGFVSLVVLFWMVSSGQLTFPTSLGDVLLAS